MNKLKLKHKILLSFIVAITITVAALSAISFNNMKARLYEDSETLVASLGKLEAEKVTRWFDVRQRMLSAAAPHLDRALLPALQQAKESGGFQLSYFGAKNGVMYDDDPSIDRTGYDPRSRPWYKQAMAANGAIITSPYEDASSCIR